MNYRLYKYSAVCVCIAILSYKLFSITHKKWKKLGHSHAHSGTYMYLFSSFFQTVKGLINNCSSQWYNKIAVYRTIVAFIIEAVGDKYF